MPIELNALQHLADEMAALQRFGEQVDDPAMTSVIGSVLTYCGEFLGQVPIAAVEETMPWWTDWPRDEDAGS